MKQHLSKFYDLLCNNHPDIGKNSYHRYSHNMDPSDVVSYLQSLSDADFIKLISDTHWNSYPLYTCGWGEKKEVNPKNYYNLISQAVGRMIFSSPKYRKIFIEKSEGIFRISTIGHTLGKEKLKAAKSGLTSKDTRVRKLAVNLLPVKDLMEIVNSEKNSAVLNRLSIRIGYLNMVSAERSSSQRWNRSRAFLNSDFDQNEISDIANKLISGKTSPVYDMDLLKKIAYHVPASELAFYLDIFNKLSNAHHKELKSIFITKMTGKADV